MPNYNDHIHKAKSNESFFKSFNLKITPYKDWVVVGVFYSALHYVDAYLAQYNLHPQDHAARNTMIAARAELLGIYGIYHELKKKRKVASYTNSTFTEGFLTNDVFLCLAAIKVDLAKNGLKI